MMMEGDYKRKHHIFKKNMRSKKEKKKQAKQRHKTRVDIQRKMQRLRRRLSRQFVKTGPFLCRQIERKKVCLMEVYKSVSER